MQTGTARFLGRTFAALALLGLGAGPVSAAFFYVGPMGDDGNPGTVQLPWRTISKANTALRPGDTVFIMDGEYRERIEPARSGTANGPITYSAYLNDTPVITAPPGRIAIVLVDRDYIRIDGLTVTGLAPFRESNIDQWALLQGADNNIIENSNFRLARGFQGVLLIDSDFNRILNNRMDQVGSRESGNGDVVSIQCSDQNLFEGNTVTRGGHDLLSLYGDRNVIRQNVLNNRWGERLGYRAVSIAANRRFCPDALGFNLFEDNIITNSLVTFDLRESVATQVSGTGQIVRQNIFTNNLSTAIASAVRPPVITEVVRNRIFNNTLYESGSLWRVRDFGNVGPANNNRFQNNAVVVAGNDEELFIDFQAPSRTPLENNFFIANSFARTSGTERFVITGIGTVTLEFLQANFGRFFRNNIEAFPEFVSVNLEDPEAFRLQPGSPLINRGAALTSTRTAGFGTSVPVVDAGYFTDGFGVVDGDLVQIGANAPIGVTAVDYEANTLSIGSALAWAAGDQVNLPFEGNAPDIGAFEFGEDEATCDGLTATIVGTAGDESLVGTSGPDVIQGLGGVDTIRGLAGDDVLCGGDGNDTILSGQGNDRAFGEGGNDRVLGGFGDDELDGGANFDQLFGNAGNDEILGGAGRDNLDGGPQQDLCDGGPPVRGDTAVNCERIRGIP